MKNVLVLLIALSAAGCRQSPVVHSFTGEALGAAWTVEYVDAGSAVPPEQLKNEVMNRLQQVEDTFSVNGASSDIRRFNATAHSNPVKLSMEISEAIRMVKMISELSGGCYDVTDKRLYDLWGFGSNSVTVPSASQIKQTLAHVNSQNLIAYGEFLRKTDAGINIDLSTLAHALGIRAAAKVLENAGVTDYVINAGGDIAVAGKKPGGSVWDPQPGLKLPHAGTLEKTIEVLPGSSMVTASVDTLFTTDDGKEYPPVIDARTGQPVTHDTVAVTVNHADPARGMAWAKALLCLGKEEGMTVATRSDIKAVFFTQENDQVVEQISPAMANVTGTQQ